MRVNQKNVSHNPPGSLTFHPLISLGLGHQQKHPGMVGCLRKVELGEERVDLRSFVGTDLAHKSVTYDGCRMLGPCERPGSCEHGTPCTVGDDDEIHCNCTNSGYTGKTCHFSLYKTSCDEYRQIGYNTTGVYKIDVDGNGPLPPAYVTCKFSSYLQETTTIIENNMPVNYEVRGPRIGNVKIDVQYRDFSSEMLQALVIKEKTCTQKVTYDCRRSPLKLSTHTWFSSPSKDYITSFGSKTPGLCRCKEIDACDKADVACNCDAVDGLGRSDVAVFQDPDFLPLTSMVFLEEKESQREESEGHLTLGSLHCTKKIAAEQAVSFSKDDVYLEVPAWRNGIISFSFKTIFNSAVLAYQPAYHPEHSTFKISLLGEKQVEFMYSTHGVEHRHSLYTAHRLNTGEWQQILIDVHLRQMRLLVNSEEKLINIEDDANLGVLDGSMFIGGMPKNLPTWKTDSEEEEEEVENVKGLKGCIRDFTVNNERVNLEQYVRAAPLGVSFSCKSSCNPNPCKNGAECIDNWGSYTCVCANPLAHSGRHCENNPNEDAITFTTQDSKLKYFVNGTAELLAENPLNSTSLLINFRTHSNQGLIFFMYDYLHNFLQLHLASSTRLVLLFNSGKDAVSLPIDTTEVLSGGQSVQLAIKRNSSSTTLSVFTRGVLLEANAASGLLLLNDDGYEQLPFGESTPLPDMVYYPHSFTKPGYFFKAYFGSANDPQFDVRTELPGLVGCVRGLQLDSGPVSLSDKLAQDLVNGVKKDCTMMCDRKPCLNGGLCKEDFLYPSSFHCDCTSTSFTGSVCSTEVAYTFHGKQWLRRASSDSLLDEGVVLELAFAASTRQSRPQIVALLRSAHSESPHNYILVLVEPNGGVTVRAVLENLAPYSQVTAEATPEQGTNVFTGHRHVLKVEWQSTKLRVMVNKREVDVSRLLGSENTGGSVVASPHSLYLGGIESGVDDRFSEYHNFHGCISNVMISKLSGKVYPLHEYSEHDPHLTSFGSPQFGSCTSFPSTPLLVMTYQGKTDMRAVSGDTKWNIRAAVRTPIDVVPSAAVEQRDTPMDNVVPAVATVVVLLVGITLALLCVRTNYSKKKEQKKAELQKNEEEKKALLMDRKKSKDETMKSRAAVVVAATTDIELALLKSTPNGKAPENKMSVVSEVKQKESPSVDHPDHAPEDVKEEEVLVRTPKESTGDRPLSWDKAADTLPLIIGTQVKPQKESENASSSSSSTSEGSSFDCTIDISGSPTSSTVPAVRPDLGVPDSPSSLRVHRGSNPMMFIDEDVSMESEPRLLHHGSLSDAGEPIEVVEPPCVEKYVYNLGEGEVQRIEKSKNEDEIVVVDDYLDDEADKDKTETIESKEVENGNQQTKADLAEAAQENNQTDSDNEAKTDQSYESAREEQIEEPKEIKEMAENKAEQENQSEKIKETSSLSEAEVTTDKQSQEGKTNEEEKQTEEKKQSSSSESDDDFVELRPETEKIAVAERINSQTLQDIQSSCGSSVLGPDDLKISQNDESLINKCIEKEADIEIEVQNTKEIINRESNIEPMIDTNINKTENKESSIERGNNKGAPNEDSSIKIINNKTEEEEVGAAQESTGKDFEDTESLMDERKIEKHLKHSIADENETEKEQMKKNNDKERESEEITRGDNAEISDYSDKEIATCVGEASDKHEAKIEAIKEIHFGKTEIVEAENGQDNTTKSDEEMNVGEKNIGDTVNTSAEIDQSQSHDSQVPEIIVSCPEEEQEPKLQFLSQIYQLENKTEGQEVIARDQDFNISGGEDSEQHNISQSPEEMNIDNKCTVDKTANINQNGINTTKVKNMENYVNNESENKDKIGNQSRNDVNFGENNEMVKNMGNNASNASDNNLDVTDSQSTDDTSSGEDDREEDNEQLSENNKLPLLDISRQMEASFQLPDDCMGSPVGEESDLESPTYLNYMQDDDLCLEINETPVKSSPGNLTPLDPISEQDESEEEKEEESKTKKTSLPASFMSKFSSGIDNLSTLSGEEEADGNCSEKEPEISTEMSTPEASSQTSSELAGNDAANEEKNKRRRRKKGYITKEKHSPIFLAEGVRTFSNPISYFGGPNIEYEEEEGGEGAVGRDRQRNDSIVSTTSLD